jgi:RNA polymerase sigma factor (sigma-70 family)
MRDFQADPKAMEAATTYESLEDERELHEYILCLLDKLTDTQRKCITLHFLDGHTQSEVSRMLGISREGVRKSVVEALKKLREAICDGQ